MSSITQLFGQRVRKLRLERNLTQEQLSEAADISISFLGGIERGLKTPTIETVQKLANALNISVTQIMTFDLPSETDKDIQLNSLVNDFIENIKNLYKK